MLGYGVEDFADGVAQAGVAAVCRWVEATLRYAVSWMALVAPSGLEASPVESDGAGDDGAGGLLGDVVDGFGVGDVGTVVDGPGVGFGLLLQLGDGDGLRTPDPTPALEPTCDCPPAPPPLWWLPGCEVPECWCELELLGDTAVDASIATYVPAATMNMTAVIAVRGLSQPCVRDRCLPGACTGEKRSQAARNSAASR